MFNDVFLHRQHDSYLKNIHLAKISLLLCTDLENIIEFQKEYKETLESYP